MIYELALQDYDDSQLKLGRSYWFERGGYPPSLTLASKQIRDEAGSLFYSSYEFQINAWLSLAKLDC